MDYEGIYRTLYDDQLEGATDEYREEFESNYSPDNIDWTDTDRCQSALCSLLSELIESRTDFYDLVSNAGLDKAALSEIGFF